MSSDTTQRLAITSSLTIAAASLLFLLIFAFPVISRYPWVVVGGIFYITIIHYLLFIYGINRSIYNRIKQIYRKIKANESNIATKSINAIEVEVDEYNKKQEIEINKLKERENYRREFIGNISHELKTPIFNIQGFILTILDGALDDDPKLSQKYLKRANKSVERMIHIIRDLEQITNLEAGELEMSMGSYNVITIAKDVVEILEQKAEKKNIKIHFKNAYPQKIMVSCDKERIAQVLTNLVVNAIKYGKDDGEIIIDITEKGDKALIKISDNGIGIPEEHLKRIFERFYRVDKARTRTRGGSGLGLAIVKHIIDAHQQSIKVESEVDKGTSFLFTLNKTK
ncbi:MAG: ATP-binding protein [Flavobacteriales bacterium]|nr:ATP-binding protein [Flavobacteriales bacterium]